jgi:crossover junction endodeoxyribonuclease RuvC
LKNLVKGVVLGIDPGFSATGFGVLEQKQSRVFLLEYGVLKLSCKDSLDKRIGIFHDFFIEKIQQWGIAHLSLETPFLGKNAQVFLKLGYLRGILYLLACKHGLQISEFSPREVKLLVTGFGGADKEQVARMIMRLFPGIIKPSKFDASDALAIALCGLWKNKTLL